MHGFLKIRRETFLKKQGELRNSKSSRKFYFIHPLCAVERYYDVYLVK
jgi:hypothetical protein